MPYYEGKNLKIKVDRMRASLEEFTQSVKFAQKSIDMWNINFSWWFGLKWNWFFGFNILNRW